MITNLRKLGILAAVVAATACGCNRARTVSGALTEGSNVTPGGQTTQNPALREWQRKYPGTASLLQSVTGMRILLQSGRHPLTREQGQSLLQTLTPIQTMATLPQDQALKLAGDVNANLTPDQQSDIGLVRGSQRARGVRRGTRRSGASSGAANPMRWIQQDMPPDKNIFQEGPPQRMLNTVVGQLEEIVKG